MDRAGDRQLVDRLARGDEGAFRRLVEQYAPRIHQLAMRYVKNPEDAEEVTQDVLLKVWRHVDSFRGDAALSSWIYRITFNTAMSRLRRRHVRVVAEQRESTGSPRVTSSDEPPFDIPDWTHMPDETVLRFELRAAVASAVRQLPEMYREPVILRDLRGLTTEEASCRLRLKDETLKSRLRRGRLMLRERLGQFSGGLALHRPSYSW